MWPSSVDLPDSGWSGSSGPSAPESRLWLSGALVSLGAPAKSLHLELIWEQNVNSKTLNDERQNATFLQNTSHSTECELWAATYLSPRFCFKWLTGLNCRGKKQATKMIEKLFLKMEQNVNMQSFDDAQECDGPFEVWQQLPEECLVGSVFPRRGWKFDSLSACIPPGSSGKWCMWTSPCFPCQYPPRNCT